MQHNRESMPKDVRIINGKNSAKQFCYSCMWTYGMKLVSW